MADYKEVWSSPEDSTVIGYIYNPTGTYFPADEVNPDYRAFLQWQAGGGVADPCYTAEEITESGTDDRKASAVAYLAATDHLVKRYQEDQAAGRTPFIPASKYSNLLKKRARAQKILDKNFDDFQQ